MAKDRRADDPAQHDRAWAGYHPRAMAPAVATVAVASLLVWTGRWYVAPLSELVVRIGALAVFAIAWGVWPAMGAVILYRTVTYTYRLTNRAVLIDFGFWYHALPPVWLNEIESVRVRAGWLSRRLGVGSVELHTVDGSVLLEGVRQPEAFAEQIRAAVQESEGRGQRAEGGGQKSEGRNQESEKT
jgi:membrane protein YdbS with pleckstrin-like domain